MVQTLADAGWVMHIVQNPIAVPTDNVDNSGDKIESLAGAAAAPLQGPSPDEGPAGALETAPKETPKNSKVKPKEAKKNSKAAKPEAKAAEPEPEPEPEQNGSTELFDEPEPDPATMAAIRTKTIEDLQAAYSGGHQKAVFDLLSKFGNGAKSFRELSVKDFIPIRKAIDAGALL